MNGTATLVKELDARASGARWKIYKLDPPLKFERWGEPERHTTYVVVSANTIPYSGPETYILASDGEGVIDWTELHGSYRGGLDHEEALRGAGYSVTS